MIEHFFSQRKGNMSVEQQEMKHFMVQCPNFMFKIYVQLPKVLLYNKQPFQSMKRGSCQWPLQGRVRPLIFRPNGGPKGQKKVFLRLFPPSPYLSVWMTRPSPLSEGMDPSLVVWVSVAKFLQKVQLFCIGEYSLLQRVFSIPSI